MLAESCPKAQLQGGGNSIPASWRTLASHLRDISGCQYVACVLFDLHVHLVCLQDLAGQPQQLGDGTLRTPGVIDFFRMLNEQVGSHGHHHCVVQCGTAQCCVGGRYYSITAWGSV
jgi:hypothetical protein